jgi:hypothetical protein
MRYWLRRQRPWLNLRRWQREGFLNAFRRARLFSAILHTAPIATGSSGDTELHLLCYRDDYLAAIWSLKTFYWHSPVSFPLWIHVQGEPVPRMLRKLRQHFPDARIVTQAEADSIVIPHLERSALTRLLAARRANPYTLKLTDFVLLGNAPNLLTIDSDILFFKQPQAFLEPSAKHRFQRDPESTYVILPEQARAAWNIDLAPRINVGMMHFRRDSVSLKRCDEYLAEFPNLNGWLEQTLYALHASESGNFEYLPDEYLISLAHGVDCSRLVARHYAGPSRPLLHLEGIPFVLKARPDIRNPPPPGTP